MHLFFFFFSWKGLGGSSKGAMESLRNADGRGESLKLSFINTFFHWTASIDFNGKNFHDFLVSFSHSRNVSFLYTSYILGL